MITISHLAFAGAGGSASGDQQARAATRAASETKSSRKKPQADSRSRDMSDDDDDDVPDQKPTSSGLGSGSGSGSGNRLVCSAKVAKLLSHVRFLSASCSCGNLEWCFFDCCWRNCKCSWCCCRHTGCQAELWQGPSVGFALISCHALIVGL